MILAIIEIRRGCISMRSLRAGMTFGVSESRQYDSFSGMIY